VENVIRCFSVLLLAASCATGTPPVRNGRIAFTAMADGHLQIFTANAIGADRLQLTTTGDNGFPSWSHDGRAIVFSSNRAGAFEIYSMDAGGTNQRPLPITGAGDKVTPRLSADGTKLAFTVLDATVGHPEIWIASGRGADPVRLTYTPPAASGPTWSLLPSFSPDGRRIAYASTRSGSTQIWVMNADGSNQTQLTRGLGADSPDANAPDWSPDGRRIAFWSGFETRYGEIWTMSADGSDARRLTVQPAPVSSDNPMWSPDGAQILFDTSRSGTPEIWMMNADGSGQRMLIPIGVANTRFAWQPVH
jgi:Tol biopolymer transport system component